MAYIIGLVEIPIVESQADLAAKLNCFMDGFALELDSSGIYEEIPVYMDVKDGMELILQGPPFEVTGASYQLEFRWDSAGSVREAVSAVKHKFIRRFLSGSWPGREDYLDCSDELAKCLTEHGIKNCRPVHLSNESVGVGC